MSTLSVTTIDTANSTTDLTLKIGNTSGPEIVLAANGSTLFNNVSTLSIGNSTVNTVIAFFKSPLEFTIKLENSNTLSGII